MAIKRFIGSGRQKEGGFLATHKQDFNAHVTGGDFRHGAIDIDMEPPITILNNIFNSPTVQGTLEKLASIFATAGQGFISIGDGYDAGDFNVGDPGIPTLQDAFNAAFQSTRLQNGGIILVKAGVYVLTGTVQVPQGITIFGEPTGTNIIGQMSEEPMFLFLRATDDLPVGPSLDLSRQKSQSKMWNMTLFDNLDGYVASGGPSMSAVPMIQCQRGSNVVIEDCTIIGRAIDTPNVSVTKRGIGYTGSSNSLPTSLEVRGTFFDAVRTAIDFDPVEGRDNVLKVLNCRARTLGDGGLVDQTDRYFCTFALCNASFANNFHIGENDTWQAEGCFLIKDLTVGDDNVFITLTGNIGDLNGSSVTALRQTNFLVDGRASKTAVRVIQSGNTWGLTYNNNFYYTVGDGTNSVGDITGTNAIDLALQKVSTGTVGAGSETIIYVLDGTYTLTEQGAVGNGAKLVGLTQGNINPTVELNLGTAQTDFIGRRTVILGDLIENIDFVNSGAAATFQSVSTPNVTNSIVKNCSFTNVGFQNVGILDGVIQNCIFNQTGTYGDNLSLDLTPFGNVLLKDNEFINRGYALSITAGFGNNGSQIVLDGNIFDPFRNVLAGPTISAVNVGGRLSHYINIDSALDELIVRNNFIKGFRTTGALDTVPGIFINNLGQFDKFIRFANVSKIKLFNNEIYGTNNNFISGVTQFATPVVYCEPGHSLYVHDNLIVGPLPIQVSGPFSSASSADPQNNNAYISVKDNELKGYPEDTANLCNTVIDLDLPTIIVTDASDSIAQCDICNNNITTGEYTTFRPVRHTNVVGGNYIFFSNIQMYGEAWRFAFNDNTVMGFFPTPYTFANGSTLRVDSEVGQSLGVSFRERASAIVMNNNFIADVNYSPTGQNFYPISVRSRKSRIESNDVRFMAAIAAAGGGELGFVENESGIKGNTIVNNTFQNGPVQIFGPSGFINLTGTGGGIVGHNVFSTPLTNNAPPTVDNAITDATIGSNWYVAPNNVGIRYNYQIRYMPGKITVNNDEYFNSGSSTVFDNIEIGFNNVNAWNVTLLPSQAANVKYKLDLKEIVPLNAKLVTLTFNFVAAADLLGSAVDLSVKQFDAVSDITLANDTESIPTLSPTLTLGSQSIPLSLDINDKYIEIELGLINNSGISNTTINVGLLDIWIEL